MEDPFEYGSSLWKADGEGGTFTRFTLQRYGAMASCDRMFHNGQAESGSACCPGVRFVYPVEALKDP